jgi:hypothetical protein
MISEPGRPFRDPQSGSWERTVSHDKNDATFYEITDFSPIFLSQTLLHSISIQLTLTQNRSD